MSPSVTVGLPAHDGERWISEAIRSVLDQRGWDVHVVVVDDGSRDSTLEVATRWARDDERVSVIDLGRNVGVAHARNVAIAAGTDPLVAFIDQDDTWRPGRLDAGWRLLREQPGLGFALGRQEFVTIGEYLPGWFRSRWADGPQPGYVLGTMLAWRDRGWDAVGPLDESLANGTDDVDWFARAGRIGVRHAMSDEVVLDRRIHGSNFSQNTDRSTPELLSVLRTHLRRMDDGD